MDVQRNNGDVKLQQVLHMNGGDGDNSYANNSFFQKEVMLKAKPVLQESIVELCKKSLGECITVADMGCSSGPNALLPTWQIIDAIDEQCNQLKKKTPTFQVFLNDLPGNDFNSIFRALPSFYKKIEEEKGSEFGPCFIGAMPGSFHGRLCPPHSLHFVHSSYSLHWCSQPPKIAQNKGNIHHLVKTCPPEIRKAYLDQYVRDFKTFLRARSQEILPQGQMVLTIGGRNNDNIHISNEDSFHNFELLGMMLKDMVSEGLIEESKLETFNIPIYAPSSQELKNMIEEEGSFRIIKFESFNISIDVNGNKDKEDKFTRGKRMANQFRSVIESIVAVHFGSELVDVIFQRFSIMMANYQGMIDNDASSHVISMIKES